MPIHGGGYIGYEQQTKQAGLISKNEYGLLTVPDSVVIELGFIKSDISGYKTKHRFMSYKGNFSQEFLMVKLSNKNS